LIGDEVNFVQDNESASTKGVLRGLHYQTGTHAQAKLVRVIEGVVLDVVVDLRKDSKTYGEQFSIELSASNKKQLFVPRGFAHGFIVLSDTATFSYKCDNYYNKASEGGIIYNDKYLNIDWQLPESQFIISEKDLVLPTFEKAIK
jgi:dTDP-4-dehydrorhamnose 3,5-epimerase